MTEPQQQDLVLGGQTPPPVSGAVLGGVDRIRERFTHFDTAQKLSALEEISGRGPGAIDFLVDTLQDRELIVRAKAYEYLKELETESAQTAIANGIPLFSGDCIYHVYELQFRYTDEYYYVVNHTPEEIYVGDFDDFILRIEYDFEDEGWLEEWEEMSEEEKQNIIDDCGQYSPYLVSSHIDSAEAQEAAEKLQRDFISDPNTPNLFEFDYFFSLDIPEWLTSHGYSVANHSHFWEEAHQILANLATENLDLLDQYWRETVGPLAIVHEQRIEHNCYFKFISTSYRVIHDVESQPIRTQP